MWLYVNEKFRYMTLKGKKLVTDLLLTQLGILVEHLERCLEAPFSIRHLYTRSSIMLTGDSENYVFVE